MLLPHSLGIRCLGFGKKNLVGLFLIETLLSQTLGLDLGQGSRSDVVEIDIVHRRRHATLHRPRVGAHGRELGDAIGIALPTTRVRLDSMRSLHTESHPSYLLLVIFALAIGQDRSRHLIVVVVILEKGMLPVLNTRPHRLDRASDRIQIAALLIGLLMQRKGRVLSERVLHAVVLHAVVLHTSIALQIVLLLLILLHREHLAHGLLHCEHVLLLRHHLHVVVRLLSIGMHRHVVHRRRLYRLHRLLCRLLLRLLLLLHRGGVVLRLLLHRVLRHGLLGVLHLLLLISKLKHQGLRRVLAVLLCLRPLLLRLVLLLLPELLLETNEGRTRRQGLLSLHRLHLLEREHGLLLLLRVVVVTAALRIVGREHGAEQVVDVCLLEESNAPSLHAALPRKPVEASSVRMTSSDEFGIPLTTASAVRPGTRRWIGPCMSEE